ncbi:hypothetical protein TWF696_008293 [Orbilia brochopaga]|uniref:Uncharacterized protein n=1 Tax=Orbilia brochopaga TaxID=3140254 RepID=A0AAV9UGI7_9PEZI
MPKRSSRRQPFNYTYKPSYQSSNRPAPHAHVAVASSSALSSSSSDAVAADPNASVTQLLNHLRLTQTPAARDDHPVDASPSLILTPAPTVHPSLQALLGIADSQPPLPPQPRARGFAVPNSWRTRNGVDPYRRLHDGQSTTSSASGFEARGSSTFPTFEVGAFDQLDDDADLPVPSLVSLCLRSVAHNWAFHVVYDRYFLRELRASHKSLLLAHLAACTLSRRQQYVDEADVLAGSIDKGSFELLFRAPFPDDAQTDIEALTAEQAQEIDRTLPMSGTEHVTHLNFAGSIGYSISLRQLAKLLTRKMNTNPARGPPFTNRNSHPPTQDIQPPQASEKGKDVLDSWEDFNDDDDSAPPIPALRTRHFASLTHLSLAYPKPAAAAVPLPDLLKLAADAVPTITHLSLAGWPLPTVSSSSSTAAIMATSLVESIRASTSMHIKRLSQSLICLRHLDVSDCDADMYLALEDADWIECWRKVDEVVVRQGRALSARGVKVLQERDRAARALEGVVRGLRRVGGGSVCRFVYGDGEGEEDGYQYIG